uniref:Uncharacterized protein n=1 Tax=Tetranychus urticae TaxID=32264 RepID=T1L5X7_TETUR
MYIEKKCVYFDTVEKAVNYCEETEGLHEVDTSLTSGNFNNTSSGHSSRSPSTVSSNLRKDDSTTKDNFNPPLIFIHSGKYKPEGLFIDSSIAMIGAGMFIYHKKNSDSTITFIEGSRRAYLGYVTLKFTPDTTSCVPHHKHYCLEITERCSPTIDHCIIRSSSAVGAAVCVSGPEASPWMSDIFRNAQRRVFVLTKSYIDPTIPRNEMHVYQGGVPRFGESRGTFPDQLSVDPIVSHNRIHHGQHVTLTILAIPGAYLSDASELESFRLLDLTKDHKKSAETSATGVPFEI